MRNKRRKVAILGLAANPIHNGHIAIANEVAKHFDLVWIVPCYKHMFAKNMADAEHRYQMCLLATKGSAKNVFVSKFEIEQKLECSTYDFLKLLQKASPDFDFAFIIGQDNSDNIEKWKHHNELISEFTFVVVPRPGMTPTDAWYRKTPHVFLEEFKPPDVSSTMIRNDIQSSVNFLHPDVVNYIQEYKLYA
jgi:nicotinate-nucleotide adenylyltransferase